MDIVKFKKLEILYLSGYNDTEWEITFHCFTYFKIQVHDFESQIFNVNTSILICFHTFMTEYLTTAIV